jgi:SulP family sulfate permease
VANIISGMVGCLPNYVCYSNSALYYKCGGGGRFFSMALALALMAFFVIGPSSIHVLPRCMAGSLLLHMGVELMREAVVEPFGGLDRVEYASVVLITLVMTFAGRPTPASHSLTHSPARSRARATVH